jgi:hypothetical protein
VSIRNSSHRRPPRPASPTRRPALGFTFWAGLPTYCVRWLGWAIGTYAARQWLLPPLRSLLTTTLDDRHGRRAPLMPSMPEDISIALGEGAQPQPEPKVHRRMVGRDAPQVRRAGPLQGAIPRAPRRRRLLAQKHGRLRLSPVARLPSPRHSALAAWTIYTGDGQDFAARLHGYASLRADAAEAVGLTLDEFDERAPAALRDMHHLNDGFSPNLRAVAILEGVTGDD